MNIKQWIKKHRVVPYGTGQSGVVVQIVHTGVSAWEGQPEVLRDDWDVMFWETGMAKPYKIEYHTGLGHRKKLKRTYPWGDDRGLGKPVTPKIESILECFASDIQAGNETFEDFCGNFGYDEDSRKAMNIYLACQGIASGLSKLLGRTAVNELAEVDLNEE